MTKYRVYSKNGSSADFKATSMNAVVDKLTESDEIENVDRWKGGKRYYLKILEKRPHWAPKRVIKAS